MQDRIVKFRPALPSSSGQTLALNALLFNTNIDGSSCAVDLVEANGSMDAVTDPLSLIDKELFYRYIAEFPCLSGSDIRLDDLQVCRDSLLLGLDGEDSSAKELALDCILELLSGGDFEITWKDIFDIFGKEDQNAFIRIMTHHSRCC